MSILGSPVNTSSSSSSSSSSGVLQSPSSSNCSSSINQNTHCNGLDLLLKAFHHLGEVEVEPIFLGGSVVPSSSTQKKVIRKGKRAPRFKKKLIPETDKEDDDMKLIPETLKKETGIEAVSNPKRPKRLMALPSKYQDSVLQPWKRCTRRIE